MINKLQLQSIIDKYYLGLNESVKWVIKDNNLSIDFMTPTKDVIGKVTYNNFDMEDGSISIYDTKKLQNLISICSGDLLLEFEKNNAVLSKSYSDNIDQSIKEILFDKNLQENLIKNGHKHVNQYLANPGNASKELARILSSF